MNKIIIIFIGCVIFSNINYASAISEIYCPDNYSNMEPSISLAAPYNKPIINPGDPMKFEVYISGYGHVENITKIYASLPIDLVDDGTPFGTLQIRGNPVNITVNSSNAFWVSLPNDFFRQLENSNCYSVLTHSELKYPYNEKMMAPVTIYIKTSEDAPVGDNKIDLILTYSNGEKWYQDRQEINFHINSPIEMNGPKLFLIFSLLGLIISIVSISEAAKQYFKKILSSKFGNVLWILIFIGIIYIIYLVYFYI